MQYFVSNHLHREEKAGYFTLFVFKCLVNVIVLWFFLIVPWVGLKCVSVLFPDHISLFRTNMRLASNYCTIRTLHLPLFRRHIL